MDPDCVGSPRSAALVLLCGLPGSGKTTLVTALMGLAKEVDVGEVHKVSFDDEYQQQRCGISEFDPTTWHQSRHVCSRKVRKILEGILEPSFTHQIVFIDDNMYYASMRRDFYRIARDMHVKFMQVHVLCPFHLCCRRDQEREIKYQVGCDVILRMKEVFDAPQKSINSWEANTLAIDSSCTDFHNHSCIHGIWRQILEILDKSHPPSPVESQDDILLRQIAGQSANNKSVVHSFDLWSRALLSATVKRVREMESSEHEMKQLGKHLNEKRRQVLQVLKTELQYDADPSIEELKKQFEMDCGVLCKDCL